MSALQRNGYATLTDLKSDDLCETVTRMENFQLEFLAVTAELWNKDFPFTGDALYAWSRQWEYPYHLVNIGVSQGRVLDAGSGITFFPFFLARQGHQVHCCDSWTILEKPIEIARQNTQLPVRFELASITRLSQPDSFFDAVCCVSVLEHLAANDRTSAIREFARVLRPGGRLIVTCDVSLGRDADMRIEEVALLLRDLLDVFEPVYPLNMHRPADLLTTDYYRKTAPWRLPWRPYRTNLRNLLRWRVGHTEFHSLAVVGLTLKPEKLGK